MSQNINEMHRDSDDLQITLIGITGRKRSGKDTIGEYLVKKCGFKRIAFADALKEACKIIFGFDNEQVYGDLKENVDDYWGHSPREILQIVGSELFRDRLPELCHNIHNDIWIKSVERQIRNLYNQGYNKFVITDARFDNEIDFIKKFNGFTWKVIRPCLMSIDNHSNTHQSEISIDNFICDYDFINDSTIANLYDKVDKNLNQCLFVDHIENI